MEATEGGRRTRPPGAELTEPAWSSFINPGWARRAHVVCGVAALVGVATLVVGVTVPATAPLALPVAWTLLTVSNIVAFTSIQAAVGVPRWTSYIGKGKRPARSPDNAAARQSARSNWASNLIFVLANKPILVGAVVGAVVGSVAAGPLVLGSTALLTAGGLLTRHSAVRLMNEATDGKGVPPMRPVLPYGVLVTMRWKTRAKGPNTLGG